jgi:hypothetical protein
MRLTFVSLLLVGAIFALRVQAKDNEPPKATPNRRNGVDVTKPLEIMGLNRNVNLMMKYKSSEVRIGFEKPRENFHLQILSTVY